MTTRRMIRMKPKRAGEPLFQLRIAGLAFRDGHLLVHRATHESFWTLPGGRAEIGESSDLTLKREMMEELGVEVGIGRMLWTVENFFHYEGVDVHELGFYYLMDVPEHFPFHRSDIVHRNIDGKSELEFKWVLATSDSLRALDIPPYFLAETIESLPETPRHIIWHDGDLDRP
ncbi:NUDIX hydrolase [Xaviernesmea oryzae]|nr:NUDIX hydrolase [Xaviernesmea oryzae]SEL13334.1 ADP-ribose pyrophosphatase YjhB, NUDIX family [Xaviernesmea oryzae]